jgi:hypothetical protein
MIDSNIIKFHSDVKEKQEKTIDPRVLTNREENVPGGLNPPGALSVFTTQRSLRGVVFN